MDLKKIARDILERGHLMSLATRDEGGLWVADVVYIYDDAFNIYWMSDPEVRHSKALLLNPQVAGSITISNKSKEPTLSLQFSGVAEKIEGPRFDLATKHLAKRGHPPPEETDDVLEGDSWYVAKPEFIDLNSEELFGFNNKQKIEL
jgi:uncharacterized protein YhbP (UPF0306 family)